MSEKKKIELTVRFARVSDEKATQAFFRKAALEVAEGMACLPNGSKASYPSPEMIADAIRHHKVFIAINKDREEFRTQDGGIIGGMISNHEYNPAFKTVRWAKELEDEEVAYWHCLRVLKDAQGQGAARTIMTKAIEIEKESGLKAIRFDTVIGNENAIRLYGHLGFDDRGIYPVYEEDIGQHESIMYEMLLEG